jgi:aldehyde dehydrogenase (NAD+)
LKRYAAFERSTRKERLDLLRAILAEYKKRGDDLADAMSREMGAPLKFARVVQAGRGTVHIEHMIDVLETYPFEFIQGTSLIACEPIGGLGTGRSIRSPARLCRPSPRAVPWC